MSYVQRPASASTTRNAQSFAIAIAAVAVVVACCYWQLAANQLAVLAAAQLPAAGLLPDYSDSNFQ